MFSSDSKSDAHFRVQFEKQKEDFDRQSGSYTIHILPGHMVSIFVVHGNFTDTPHFTLITCLCYLNIYFGIYVLLRISNM